MTRDSRKQLLSIPPTTEARGYPHAPDNRLRLNRALADAHHRLGATFNIDHEYRTPPPRPTTRLRCLSARPSISITNTAPGRPANDASRLRQVASSSEASCS